SKPLPAGTVQQSPLGRLRHGRRSEMAAIHRHSSEITHAQRETQGVVHLVLERLPKLPRRDWRPRVLRKSELLSVYTGVLHQTGKVILRFSQYFSILLERPIHLCV